MTDSENLARWQGWQVNQYGYMNPPNMHPMMNVMHNYPLPDYPNDDSAAMSLLDTLVEKGHEPKLQYYHNIKQWGVMPGEDYGYEWLDDTRHAAVVAAVLELIGKEDV